jgi:hypothetical protein
MSRCGNVLIYNHPYKGSGGAGVKFQDVIVCMYDCFKVREATWDTHAKLPPIHMGGLLPLYGHLDLKYN